MKISFFTHNYGTNKIVRDNDLTKFVQSPKLKISAPRVGPIFTSAIKVTKPRLSSSGVEYSDDKTNGFKEKHGTTVNFGKDSC